VLANPLVPCATAEVFKAMALHPGDIRPPSKRAEWRNDMTAAAIRTQPIISDVLVALGQTALHPVLMSGSGATCFGMARDFEEAETVARQLAKTHPQWWVRAARLE
jgi:4-diphosphocytidyl-2-C-methyl-D-erythritol kinase